MNSIIEMFETSRARSWMKQRKLNIAAPHIPLVWVATSQRTALHAVIAAGQVKIVDGKYLVKMF